jgi:hypothetical protein
MARTDVELAEMAARKFAARSGGRADWRELVGLAWSGIAGREASRARRDLPPMTESQRYMAAYSELVDDLRRGDGGFAGTRYRETPLVGRWSDLGDDAEGWLTELADRPAFAVVPAAVGQYRRFWSPAEDRALAQALRVGATFAEVARGLGRTKAGVMNRVGKLGVKSRWAGRPPDAARRSEMLRLLAAGHTLSDAARTFGVKESTARVLAKRMVRDGLLVRTGGLSWSCRYVPAPAAGTRRSGPSGGGPVRR